MKMLYFPPCFSISLCRNIEWGPGKKVASKNVAKYATDIFKSREKYFSEIILKIIFKIIILPLHAPIGNEPINETLLLLPDAINATDGLCIVNRIPTDVEHDDTRGGGDINADAAGSR